MQGMTEESAEVWVGASELRQGGQESVTQTPGAASVKS